MHLPSLLLICWLIGLVCIRPVIVHSALVLGSLLKLLVLVSLQRRYHRLLHVRACVGRVWVVVRADIPAFNNLAEGILRYHVEGVEFMVIEEGSFPLEFVGFPGQFFVFLIELFFPDIEFFLPGI